MLIHSDVLGSPQITTLSGSHWFVIFIDDCTIITWVCQMKSKGEVYLVFQRFHKIVHTQYSA